MTEPAGTPPVPRSVDAVLEEARSRIDRRATDYQAWAAAGPPTTRDRA